MFSDCADPPTITVGMAGDIMQGASVATAPYAANIEITFTCQSGWYLVGPTMSTCQGSPTFQWNVLQSNVPRCLQGRK